MAPPFLPIFLSLFIASRITPGLGAAPRPDHATFLLPFDAGFAPRWYMDGTPAVPAQLASPNPRHPLNGIAPRDVSICDAGFHSCVEANAPGMCCPNDRYCYLNATWTANCCSLGVTCPDSLCKADELYCNTTSSTTIPATTAGTARSGHDNTVTSLVSVTTFAACCNRACSASAFSCEKAFGGQCCSYGFKCASGSACIADPAPATTSSVSTIVPEIPPGCTTSQITCAETDGGGCCNTGSICTSQTIGTTASQVCAPNPTLAADDGSSGGLSSGAKAGIGVGVAVGAAIVIAAVTWLCIRQRRRSGTTGTNVSAHEMRQNASTPGGAGDEDAGNSLLVGPRSPYTLRSAFTDGTEHTSPLLHEHGRAYSYRLPDAMAGPFTDRDGDGQVAPNPSLATTPPTRSLPSDGGGRFAGLMPNHPDNIMRPVEIGEGEAARKETGKDAEKAQIDEMPGHDPTVGRFELEGSPGSPSPLKPDGESRSTDKGRK
ncbi:hypothetical protein F5Y03DRAFT_187453 [Xylaria venustula]|nr:hypothetical protein F5Y03DRAFT_187453 [Xylaria venustula]